MPCVEYKPQAEIKNAIIKKVSIDASDHDSLIVWVFLRLADGEQGFGGYINYTPKSALDTTGTFLWHIMRAAGVLKWEDAAGKPVRIKGTPTKIEAIGHFIYEDRWFNPSEMVP